MGIFGPTHPAKTEEEHFKIHAGMATFTFGLFSFLILLTLFWDFVLFHNPQVVEFHIDSATMSGLKVSDSMLTGTWDFTLVASNPNQKVSINLDTIKASLYKEDYRRYYAINRLPSLFINSSSHTHVSFSLGVVNLYIDADEAIEIFEEKITRNLVQFKLWLEIRYTYRTRFWDVWDIKDSGSIQYISCDPVQFVYSPNNDTGVFTGKSTVCHQGT